MSDTSIVDQRRSFFGGGIDAEREAIADALAAGFTFADLISTATLISDIPTEDPAVAGVIWNDAGTLKASAGA